MPTCLDLPEIETIMVECQRPVRRLASAESASSNRAATAAVANAIFTSHRRPLIELPMSPPRLMKDAAKAAAANDPRRLCRRYSDCQSHILTIRGRIQPGSALT